MPIVRRIARPLLASIFIAGGIDAYRKPAPRAVMADRVVGGLTKKLPAMSNSEQLVKADAVAKVLGGTALALNRAPRLAALGLVASMVPTTLAGHRFWEETDPAKKAIQRTQFLKNASILGGLLLAAVDTEGKPSVGWRARRAARSLRSDAGSKVHNLSDSVHELLPN